MPSATEYMGYAVTNLGPLTTTFTAAPSCATADNALYYANASAPAQNLGRPTCAWGPWGDACYPSGARLDSLLAASTLPGGFAHYYSPGVACPAGWTTAGAAASAGAGASSGALNASGVFTQDPWGEFREYGVVDAQLPLGEVYLGALDAAETLVFCCPSGYAGDIHGGCSSSLAPLTSYSFSDYCVVYYPDDDYVTVSTVTEASLTVNLISITATSDAVSTFTEGLTAWYSSARADIAIATMVPAVALVYQESDLPSSGAILSPGSSVLLTLLLPLWLLIGIVTGARMIIR
ncbi:hypothetical protein F4809DRAFT_661118 [Biscogniauxia mediterranea]|nr:hypothetical protein F4809DRAFT_661118 [Biscogniauxia mediterranea]